MGNGQGDSEAPGASQAGGLRPKYNMDNGGHYGASQQIAAGGGAPNADIYTGTWANVTQGLANQPRDILMVYWQHILDHLEHDTHEYKIHQLPLARIKKVMKADPDVKMISAEAPILFAKGCDVFITELTMRAWIHAEENKRRTLQRSDIANALSKSDMFDFLIDIVPREEAAAHSKRSAGGAAASAGASASTTNVPNAHGGAVQQQHGIPDYGLQTEQEYRPGMYAPPGQDGAPNYGQPAGQFMPDMYGYPSMNPPQ